MPPVYRNEEDERRIDAAIKNGSEQAEWTKIMEENWRLVSGELFFGNRSGEFLSRLSTKSMYRTIGRPVTDGCYGRLFMLSQGCSMADTLDPGKAAEYQNAGEAAIRFLQENPVNREMSYDEKKRASAVHGKMFHEAASQLMNEEFPDINWKDPVAVAGIFRYVSALSDMAINFVQIKQDITHEDGFIEAYGSQHALDDMDYKIGNMGWFAQEAERAYNAAIPVNERFAGRAALNHFAPVFSGKKVSELPNDLDLGAKIQRYSMEAKMWYSQAQPEERQKMEAYLNGTGPEPPYILEQFARAAEEEGILHHRSEDRKITDEELGGREHGSVTMLRLFHDNPAQPSRYFRLRQQRGNLRVNDDTPQKERQEKEELIREGSLCFEVLSRQMNLNVNHPLYENAGYHYPEELFFIDGIPATEYIKQRYPDMSIKGNVADRKLFQAEVISAVLSGEHHVEVAQMGIGKNGAYEVSVQEVRADTKIMDGQERFYQTRPSKKLESFYRDDKNRDQRLAGIRTQVSEKLAMAAGNIINRKEAEKEPYAAAAKKFSLGSAELNRQYFDWRSLERLKEIPGKASAELPRGDFGGYRTYAQMLLLAEHPEIRFADLMNPDKFINEKRRAGERVAHAFHSLYMEMDPNNPDDKTYLQPAVEIMKTSMKAIGEMDLRKELLYALGEPEDLPEEAVREIISKPENQPMVNVFLASVSSFSVNSFQSLGRVVAKKDQSVTELNAADRDKYPPVYAALADALDGETQERYRAANQFTRSLNMEKMWKNAVSAAAEGRADTSQEALKRNLTYRVIGDFLREEIVRHGKAAEIPNSEALLNLSRIGGPDFNRVEETVEQEMAAGNPKISMEYLKNNSLDQAERNKIRFFAKINKTEETAEKEETPRARRMTISLAELERTEGKRSSREVQAEREKRGNQPVRAAQPEKSRGVQK